MNDTTSPAACQAAGSELAALATGTPLLPIASIRIDGGTQIRGLNEANVERLANVLRDGGTFRDNITAWCDGNDYWLSHGFHRMEAYKRHGVEEIPVDVQQGTVDDARDDACRPHNTGHGLPETRADRERRFKHAIRLHPKWALQRIAKLVGGSDTTIKKYRDEMESMSQSGTCSTVETSDGREYPRTTAPREQNPRIVDTDAEGPSASTMPEFTGKMAWYTPHLYVEASRDVLGQIDLDPASCEVAQEIVQASKYYTAEDDGLTHVWQGNVFINPPFCSPTMGQFVAKLIDEHKAGNVPAAILLSNSATETKWWQSAAEVATAVCFAAKRIPFYDEHGNVASPCYGQCFFYFGEHPERFVERFSEIGPCMNSAERFMPRLKLQGDVASDEEDLQDGGGKKKRTPSALVQDILQDIESLVGQLERSGRTSEFEVERAVNWLQQARTYVSEGCGFLVQEGGLVNTPMEDAA